MSIAPWKTLGSMAVAVGAVALPSAWQLPVSLVYNATASTPVGWYAVVPATTLRVGDLVLMHLPPDVAAMAAERQYLPASVPLLKPVGAMAGHAVCSQGSSVMIDGRTVAQLLKRDGLGRVLTPWPGCRALKDGEVFLLSHNRPASFDSRYFGPVQSTLIVGRAIPVWTW